MIFTGVRYILFNGDHKNIVSDSKSDSMERNTLSGIEKVRRLHIADDLFYTKGRIKEVIIKTTDGKKFIIPSGI
jgi:hypothetical protein